MSLTGATGSVITISMLPDRWIETLIPPEKITPDAYREWRPLVRDALSFVFSRLSPARLSEKIAQQIGMPRTATPAERLVQLIGRMPGLQKLGQVLARNRRLDPALKKELTMLEDGIRDVSFEEIRAVIVKELGPKLDALSVTIEPRIFSEASVSAVVRFSCRRSFGSSGSRGGRGVFKVLKPHIPGCFAEDMRLLGDLAEFVGADASRYGLVGDHIAETFVEIKRLLEREIQFDHEQANLREAAQSYGSLPGIRVPQPIPELCTPVITAMTEEDGVKATSLGAMAPDARHDIARRLAEALLITPLFSSVEEALFHADPHAGNLLYDAPRRELAVLDWALTEKLHRRERRQLFLLFSMVALRDGDGMSLAIAELGQSDEGASRVVRQTVREYIRCLPEGRVPGALDALNLMDMLGRRGVRFPSPLLMFRKSLFTLDGVLHDIAGVHINLDDVVARYIAKAWLRGVAPPIPLHSVDWAAIAASIAFYGARVWLQSIDRRGPALPYCIG